MHSRADTEEIAFDPSDIHLIRALSRGKGLSWGIDLMEKINEIPDDNQAERDLSRKATEKWNTNEGLHQEIEVFEDLQSENEEEDEAGFEHSNIVYDIVEEQDDNEKIESNAILQYEDNRPPKTCFDLLEPPRMSPLRFFLFW